MRATETLDGEQRLALESLLRSLADDEYVIAERYIEWQVYAPTLESDLALSNIAQDEVGHARLWYDLLMDLGYDETDLLWERDPETFRHATIAELPFVEGDWADAVVRSYLYDVAEELRLEALEDSSYPGIADRVGKIRSEEDYHLEHAQNWLERLAEGEEGHERLQDAVDRLFPHALTLFEPPAPVPIDGGETEDVPSATEIEETIVDEGYRSASLAELGERWAERVVPYLESLDLRTPIPEDGEITEELLPDQRGRDGTHTEAWYELYDDFTHTYRELGRDYAETIMDKPE